MNSERALREVQALAALSSSNHVVRYFDAWIEEDLLYIQLERLDGCSLDSFVNKYAPHKVPEEVLCKLLCHIAQVSSLQHCKLIRRLVGCLVNARPYTTCIARRWCTWTSSCKMSWLVRGKSTRSVLFLRCCFGIMLTNGYLLCMQLGDLGTVAHLDGSMEITEGDNRYLSRYVLSRPCY